MSDTKHTPRMSRWLAQVIQDDPRAPRISDRVLCTMMRNSLKVAARSGGAEGFRPQTVWRSLQLADEEASSLLDQRDALLKVAELIYDICDNEGDGAPDDHPHTKRLLEFAGWLEPVIAKAKEEA